MKLCNYKSKEANCKDLWKQQLKDLGMSKAITATMQLHKEQLLIDSTATPCHYRFQEMQLITHCKYTTVVAYYEKMKLTQHHTTE